MSPLLLLLLVSGALLLSILGTAVVARALWHKPPPGHALLINKIDRVEVSHTGALVLPILHRAQLVDLTVRKLDVEGQGPTRDGRSVRFAVSAFFHVRATAEDIQLVAQRLGEKANDPASVHMLFHDRVREAVRSVLSALPADEVVREHERDQVRSRIIDVIGADLGGYALSDLHITALA